MATAADRVEVRRAVAAPPERVWELVSDVTRMGEWSPETTSAQWRDGATGPAVGARFGGTNRRGWRRWSTTCRVVECEPGRSFVFDVDFNGIPVSRWGYRFEPDGDGTAVTEWWEDRRPRAFALVVGPFMGTGDHAEHNRQGMEATLERVAAAAERGG